MEDPGQDLNSVKATDVPTRQRQQELADVARSLMKFRPTLIAIERVQASAKAHGSEAQLQAMLDETGRATGRR